MTRRLLNLAALLSLAVFFASVVASVRAYWDSDVFDGSLPFAFGPRARTDRTMFRVRNDVHALLVQWLVDTPSPRSSPFSLRHANDAYLTPDPLLDLPGLRIFKHEAYVAHWLISSLAFPLPALVLLSRLRNVRWFAAGRCPECGYDLRVTPGRCTECGWGTSPGPNSGDEGTPTAH